MDSSDIIVRGIMKEHALLLSVYKSTAYESMKPATKMNQIIFRLLLAVYVCIKLMEITPIRKIESRLILLFLWRLRGSVFKVMFDCMLEIKKKFCFPALSGRIFFYKNIEPTK